jgi:uncharacterized protein (TIGR02466 family)
MEWSAAPTATVRAAATQLARDAVKAMPHDLRAWEYLVDTLLYQRQYAEAADVLQRAARHVPSSPALEVFRSRAARLLGDPELALAASAAALALVPGHPAAVCERFEALALSGAAEEAAAMLDDVLELPQSRTMLQPVTATMIRAGRIDDALTLLHDVVVEQPAWSEAVYLLGVTLAQAGRGAEASRVIDPVRFMRRVSPPAPSDFAHDDHGFRQALIEEIDANPTLRLNPSDTTTRDALQTSAFPQTTQALTTLFSLIRPAVDAYAASLSPGDDHPFALGRPHKATMSAWAVVYPQRGYQDAHIHGRSWLSGVYYVTVPSPPADNPEGGALVLGGTVDSRVTAPWRTEVLIPRTGEVILFPSWVPHATRPTGSTARRIVVAFDVTPAKR